MYVVEVGSPLKGTIFGIFLDRLCDDYFSYTQFAYIISVFSLGITAWFGGRLPRLGQRHVVLKARCLWKDTEGGHGDLMKCRLYNEPHLAKTSLGNNCIVAKCTNHDQTSHMRRLVWICTLRWVLLRHGSTTTSRTGLQSQQLKTKW